jgi:hypothetical protein
VPPTRLLLGLLIPVGMAGFLVVALGESIVAVSIGVAADELRAGSILIAAAVLPTALVGLTATPEAQLGVLAAIVAAGIMAEATWTKRRQTANA